MTLLDMSNASNQLVPMPSFYRDLTSILVFVFANSRFYIYVENLQCAIKAAISQVFSDDHILKFNTLCHKDP